LLKTLNWSADVQKKDDKRIEDRLDTIIRLLEDLFILQASRAKIGRENIRAVLRVTPNRISKISKGLKQST
jgi:hypothetical protein